MKISILTLFPQMFQGPFDYSIISRAKEKGLVEIEFIDIRDFGIGKHKTVDDTPYGGGQGMILKVDVLKAAIDHALDSKLSKNEQKIILMTATGKTYNQNIAKEYSLLKHLIIICGHYEGVDARIANFIDEEISIGDFILTGGEIPAMLISDSVARLVLGVLKEGVTDNESFSNENVLEYPQFTRPETFEGLSVPEVLQKGNHAKIAEWKENSKKKKN
jgi:tRNA (guanine37-N1)-methyltransferase